MAALTLPDGTVLLGLAEVADGDVWLVPIGRDFATTTILCRRDLCRNEARAPTTTCGEPG